MRRIMCDTDGQFYVQQRNDIGLYENESPALGKGKEGFNAAKEWLENAEKGEDQ